MKRDIITTNKTVVGISLLLTNIFYIIICWVLLRFVLDATFGDYLIASLALFGGIAITVTPSIIYLKHALIDDLAIEKIVIRLSLYHVTSILGLLYFIMVTFEII